VDVAVVACPVGDSERRPVAAVATGVPCGVRNAAPLGPTSLKPGVGGDVAVGPETRVLHAVDVVLRNGAITVSIGRARLH
jgi:hypothetical protein